MFQTCFLQQPERQCLWESLFLQILDVTTRTVGLSFEKHLYQFCLLTLLRTASVCVPAISMTLYKVTKNKRISLLMRQLTDKKTVACKFSLCASTLCSNLLETLNACLIFDLSKAKSVVEAVEVQ